MPKIASTCLVLLSLLTGPVPIAAEEPFKLVGSQTIWDQRPRDPGTDLARFRDCWFVVFTEDAADPARQGAVRLITSRDGEHWEAVARFTSPTPNRGLYSPRLTVSPDGHLMISALGVVPNPYAAEPVPKYGGTINTMAWYSEDGHAWSPKTKQIGERDFPFSRVVWKDERAFSYGHGCICGSAQTIQIFSSTDNGGFRSRFKETFTGFFPDEASIAFDGDRAYCLMTRNNGSLANSGWKNAYLGASSAPYADWEWTEVDARIRYPNLLRLTDQRLIAAVAIIDSRTRLALCELDPASGKLIERLEFAADGPLMPVGLAWHDGYLWASYHAAGDGGLAVHLAQISVR